MNNNKKKPGKKSTPSIKPRSSLKKKYSAMEKKMYLLEHMGVMTFEAIAKHLECSIDRLFDIQKQIRKERNKLNIHPDLVSETAEKQFNRLNTSAQLAFNNLIRYEQMLQAGTVEMKDYFQIRYSYLQAENAITKFMKALGFYAPDINLQQHTTNVQILNMDAEQALQEVWKDYREETAKEIESRILEKRKRESRKVREVNPEDAG